MGCRTTRVVRANWGIYPNADGRVTVANGGYTVNELPHCVRSIYLGPRDTSGIVLMKMPMFSDFIPITPDCPWTGEIRGPLYFLPAYPLGVGVSNGTLYPTLDLILGESTVPFQPRRMGVVYSTAAGATGAVGGWVYNRKSLAVYALNNTVGNVVLTYYNETWTEGVTADFVTTAVGTETLAAGVSVFRSSLDATAMRSSDPRSFHRFYVSPDTALAAGNLKVVAND